MLYLIFFFPAWLSLHRAHTCNLPYATVQSLITIIEVRIIKRSGLFSCHFIPFNQCQKVRKKIICKIDFFFPNISILPVEGEGISKKLEVSMPPLVFAGNEIDFLETPELRRLEDKF